MKTGEDAAIGIGISVAWGTESPTGGAGGTTYAGGGSLMFDRLNIKSA